MFTFSIIAFLSSEYLLYSFNKEIKFFLNIDWQYLGFFSDAGFRRISCKMQNCLEMAENLSPATEANWQTFLAFF